MSENKPQPSLSLANPHPSGASAIQKVALAIGSLGVLLLFAGFFGGSAFNTSLLLWPSLILMIVGTVAYTLTTYKGLPEGIKNNGNFTNSLTSRGALGWIAGVIITGFYVLLYWYPQVLGMGSDGAASSGLVGMFDPLSYLLKGMPASQWFVYGTLYTVAVLIFGFKFLWKYRHNRYQRIRTLSVMFFQTGFAFLIPEILERLNPATATQWFDKDMKNMWPLDYDFFFDWHLSNMAGNGKLGMFMLVSGLLMMFVISPILTYFYGKRWYCSWVCGCGGLAETAGDPFRHLSDKSLKAWRLERIVIYSVLVFVTVMTIAVLFTVLESGKYLVTKHIFVGIVTVILAALMILVLVSKTIKEQTKTNIRYLIVGVLFAILAFTLYAYVTGGKVFFIDSYKLQKWYGFYIGAAFSGVIGVGFYPILGSRVWCRFGCPMAAILGLQQKFFSRFRITTNGSQCISCGNCSTYCEMGIDVRAYAQKGQDIVRASCVGCGICAAVCPRGVLKLENGPEESRKVFDLTDGGIKVNV